MSALQSLMSALNEQFHTKITSMFFETFGDEVGIIVDPETEAEELLRIDGQMLDEEQVMVLRYYEAGWNDAMESIGTLAEAAEEGEFDG